MQIFVSMTDFTNDSYFNRTLLTNVSAFYGNDTYLLFNVTQFTSETLTWNITRELKLEQDQRLFRNVIIACVAVIIMATTIFGNTLVIIAVCTERRLRKVGNSFIVSLAVSDLLVGLIVTPLSLSYELLQEWKLGKALCDFWVLMDIICCTASIVNLCVISYDRHNAITRPLVYAMKRTPRRAGFMISIAWLYAIVIALPPLLGWREESPEETLEPITQCHVTENPGYTIFSTSGAFFIPAVVMATMYIRVYKAAKKRQKHWALAPGSKNCFMKRSFRKRKNTPSFDNFYHSDISAKQKDNSLFRFNRKRKVIKFKTINPHIGFRLMLTGQKNWELQDTTNLARTSGQVERPSILLSCDSQNECSNTCDSNITYQESNLLSPQRSKHPVSPVSSAVTDITNELCINNGNYVIDEDDEGLESSQDGTPDVSHRPGGSLTNIPSKAKWRRSVRFDQRCDTKSRRTNGFQGNNKFKMTAHTSKGTLVPTSQNRRGRRPTLVAIKGILQPRKKITIEDEFTGTLNNGLKQLKKKQKNNKIYFQQERRAAKTLGIIMSAFVFCWLPFFIQALFQPFCQCFPDIYLRVVLWLGYVNSALNPVIYTFFNRDFRQAFKNILTCCCKKEQRKQSSNL